MDGQIRMYANLLEKIKKFEQELDNIPYSKKEKEIVTDDVMSKIFDNYKKDFKLDEIKKLEKNLEDLLEAAIAERQKNPVTGLGYTSPLSPLESSPGRLGISTISDIVNNSTTLDNYSPVQQFGVQNGTIAHEFERYMVVLLNGTGPNIIPSVLRRKVNESREDAKLKFAYMVELDDVKFIIELITNKNLGQRINTDSKKIDEIKKELERIETSLSTEKISKIKVDPAQPLVFDEYDIRNMSAVRLIRAVKDKLLKYNDNEYKEIWENIKSDTPLTADEILSFAKENKLVLPGFAEEDDPTIKIETAEDIEKVPPFMINGEIIRAIALKERTLEVVHYDTDPVNRDGNDESDDASSSENDEDSIDGQSGNDEDSIGDQSESDEDGNSHVDNVDLTQELFGDFSIIFGPFEMAQILDGNFRNEKGRDSQFIASYINLSFNGARSGVPPDVLEAARSNTPLENYYNVMRERLQYSVMVAISEAVRYPDLLSPALFESIDRLDVRRMRITRTEAIALDANATTVIEDTEIIRHLFEYTLPRIPEDQPENVRRQPKNPGKEEEDGDEEGSDEEGSNEVRNDKTRVVEGGGGMEQVIQPDDGAGIARYTEFYPETLFAQNPEEIYELEQMRARLLEKLATEPPPPKTLVLSYSADRLATYARYRRDDIEEAYLSFYAQGVDCDQLGAGSDVLHLVHRAQSGIHRAEILLPTDLRIDGTLYGTLTIHWRRAATVELRAPGALEHTATLHDVRSGTRMRGRDAVGARITWRVPESIVRPELGAGVPHGAMIEYEGAPSAASRAPDLFHLTAAGRLEAPERVSRRLDESSYQRAFADRLIAHLATLAPPDGAAIGRENLERAQLIVRILNGMLLGSEPLPNSFVLAYALGRS